jgi:thymidylate kinase
VLIAVDGLDGSGKTTASRLLFDYLAIDKNHPVHHVVMPGATALGQELQRIVKSKVYLPSPVVERLIFAADTVQFETEFTEAIHSGEWIVCDRFSRITDLVYGTASGLDIGYLTHLQDTIGEWMKAEIFFVLQIPLEVALERKAAMAGGESIKDRCRIEDKGKAFLARVADSYNSIIPFDPAEHQLIQPRSQLQIEIEKRCNRIVCVDAARTAKEVFEEIRGHVDALLEAQK